MDLSNLDIIVAKYKESTEWLAQLLDLGATVYLYDKYPDQPPSTLLLKYKDNMNKDKKPCLVYNTLPNVGKESHTYLHHILTYRDDIKEYTLFTQADPFDHIVKGRVATLTDMKNKINNFIFSNSTSNTILNTKSNIASNSTSNTTLNFQGFGHKNYTLLIGLGGRRNDIIKKIYNSLFGKELDTTSRFRNAGIFMTTKESILSRSPQFYEKCINTNLSKKVNPHEGFCFERLWQIIFDKDHIAII